MRDTVAYLQSFARFPLALRAFLLSYLNAVLDEIGRVPALSKVEGPR